jgi:hypothetical protein
MRFDDQQAFAYEKSFFATGSIRDLWLADDGTQERFAMSGLADFREALFITHEWYTSSFPRLCFKEITVEVPIDDLYNEPLARHKTFTRLLSLPVKIEQEKVSLSRKETGPERKQTMRLWMGIMNLMELDYWPRVGDEYTYRNVLYEVTLVHADPADYFQQSGYPLHLSISARQVQLGDWPLSRRPHERLTDTGAGELPSDGIPETHMEAAAHAAPLEQSAGQSVGPTPGDGENMVSPDPGTPFVDLPPPDDTYC